MVGQHSSDSCKTFPYDHSVATEDVLGSGSTQSTTDESDIGQDDAFWNALNANVKNLHAVISGHGMFFSVLQRLHDPCLLSQIMVTNGVSVNPPRMSSFALINMPDTEVTGMHLGDMVYATWFLAHRTQ